MKEGEADSLPEERRSSKDNEVQNDGSKESHEAENSHDADAPKEPAAKDNGKKDHEVHNDGSKKSHEAENNHDADPSKQPPANGDPPITSADDSIASDAKSKNAATEELKTDKLAISEKSGHVEVTSPEQREPERDALLKEREPENSPMVDDLKDQQAILSEQPKPKHNASVEDSKGKNIDISLETAFAEDAVEEASEAVKNSKQETPKAQEDSGSDHFKSQQHILVEEPTLENSQSENKEARGFDQPKSRNNDTLEKSKPVSESSHIVAASTAEHPISEQEDATLKDSTKAAKSEDEKKSDSEQPKKPEAQMSDEEMQEFSRKQKLREVVEWAKKQVGPKSFADLKKERQKVMMEEETRKQEMVELAKKKVAAILQKQVGCEDVAAVVSPVGSIVKEKQKEEALVIEPFNLRQNTLTKLGDEKKSESEQPTLTENSEARSSLAVSENSKTVEDNMSEQPIERPIVEQDAALKESSAAKMSTESGDVKKCDSESATVGKPKVDTATGLEKTDAEKARSSEESKSESKPEKDLVVEEPKTNTSAGVRKAEAKEASASEESKSESKPEKDLVNEEPKTNTGAGVGKAEAKEASASEESKSESKPEKDLVVEEPKTNTSAGVGKVEAKEASVPEASESESKPESDVVGKPKADTGTGQGKPEDKEAILSEQSTSKEFITSVFNAAKNTTSSDSKSDQLNTLDESNITNATLMRKDVEDRKKEEQSQSKKDNAIEKPKMREGNKIHDDHLDIDDELEEEKTQGDIDKDKEYADNDEIPSLESDSMMNIEAFEELIRLETMKQLEAAWKAQSRLVRACYSVSLKKTTVSSQDEKLGQNDVRMPPKKKPKLPNSEALSNSVEKSNEKETQNIGVPAKKKTKVSSHNTDFLQGSKMGKVTTAKTKAKLTSSKLTLAKYEADPKLSAKELIAIRDILKLKQGLSLAKQLPSSNTRVCGNGVNKFQIPLRHYNPLKDLHRSIVQNVKNSTAKKGAAHDAKRRMYGFLPGQREKLLETGIKLQTFGQQGEHEHLHILRNATVDLEREGNVSVGKGNLSDRATKVITPVLTWEALKGISEHIQPLVTDMYRPYVCMEHLIAVQPNLPDGAPYQPLHLEYPRHDGFGVVIVILALFGDSSKVVVTNDCVEGEGMKWSFSLRSGEAYILSGESRNICRHGVLCDKASEMENIKDASRIRSPRKTLILRYGLHTQNFANSEFMKHLYKDFNQ